MIEVKMMIHVLLVLCLMGIALTIAADEWSGSRRWKLAITLVIIAYAGASVLR